MIGAGAPDSPQAGPSRSPEATIDLAAFRANVRLLADTAAPAEVMLAVKANAYGHGLLEMARAGLEAGATALAVLEIPAGLELRAAGVTVPLFAWLHGVDTDFRAGVEAGIELGVSAAWQLERIAASGADRPGIVHLKLDTGLSRNGATIEQWPGLVDRALELQRAGLVRLRGGWSHLADASVADDEAALALFLQGLAIAREHGAEFEVVHLAASSAGIRMPEARFDYVRFGIAAYGMSPFDDRTGAELGLVAPLTFSAPVVELVRGEVSATVIGAGFQHGVHPAGAGAEVLLGGTRRRVLSVEADRMCVVASDADADADALGDTAVLFGPGRSGEPTAEDWAMACGTIADEIITRLPAALPRRYLNRAI